jgi:hypothetical protein
MRAEEFVVEAGKVDTTGYNLVKKNNGVELWINQKDPHEAIAILDDGAWDGYELDDNTWEFEKRRGRYGVFYLDDLNQLFEDQLDEHEMVFSRAGNKLKTKWRCTSGARSGRVVGNAKDCDKPIDQKKRAQMKVTRKTKAKQAARKAKKTKRVNPASKLLSMLNKMRKASVTSGGKVKKAYKQPKSSLKGTVKPRKTVKTRK